MSPYGSHSAGRLKTAVQVKERANALDTNEEWRGTINIPLEYATYHIRPINMFH